MNTRSLLALLAGPLVCLLIWLGPAPANLSSQGQAALAVMALCMLWWLFTPVALPAVSVVISLTRAPATSSAPWAIARGQYVRSVEALARW